MKQENPISILASYFLSQCYNKSQVSKISSYSSAHSQSFTLSDERERYLQKTEDAITKIGDCSNIYQIQTLIRKLPLEVQYFIFERATVILALSYHQGMLPLQVLDDLSQTDKPISQKILLLIQQLWAHTLGVIELDNQTVDQMLSKIFHGQL